MTSLSEHAGADEGLHRFEEIFYAMLESSFTRRRPHYVEHLTRFIAESFGGPIRFTRQLGFQDFREVPRLRWPA